MTAPPTLAAPATPAATRNANSKPRGKEEPPKAREYNQRWLGYSCIILSSVVSFASITNVIRNENDVPGQGLWVTGQACGTITFSLSFIILIFDRFKCAEKCFDYTKSCDGKLEGYVLLLYVVLWVVGVSVLTGPDGVAYYTSNIFFSSWAALAACVYTLNEWTSEKDIISIRELTQLSATLKTWYVLLLFSFVHFGSAVAIFSAVKYNDSQGDAAFAISIGLISSLVSLIWILIHYKFFEGFKQGGWLELATAFFLILMWTIGLTIFTQYEGIAPSAVGTVCRADRELSLLDNCTVVVQEFNETLNETVTRTQPCQTLYEDDVPGSNLYLSGWGALFASVNLSLRWKAAQALQFAQAAQNVTGAGSTGPDEDDEDAL